MTVWYSNWGRRVIMHFIDVCRKYLGWCPNAQAQVRIEKAQSFDEEVVPPGSGSFHDRALHWLGLFQNQILLQTILTVSAGVFIYAGLGGVSHWILFLAGILAGMPLSAAFGFLYWRIFNEILSVGPVVLWNRYVKTWWIITGVTVAASLCIWSFVLLGRIPGVSLEMITAFFGGFISVSFIGMLVSIWKWESGTHRKLHYDGQILGLEEEGNHAPR